MPLLRQSLYSQNVNIYLAPTADARDTWLPLMRTVAAEGRCFVLSANQCVRHSELPDWITGQNQTQNQELKHETQTPLQHRKLSITAEGPHEIVWPQTQSQTLNEMNRMYSILYIFLICINILLTRLTVPVTPSTEANDYVCRGGSCIVSPMGEVLAGPLWEVCTDDTPDSDDVAVLSSTPGTSVADAGKEANAAAGDGLAITTIDLDDCERGRLDLDVAGSYSRNDAFKLTVEGLDLDPPPL